jgi:hypothetical protein
MSEESENDFEVFFSLGTWNKLLAHLAECVNFPCAFQLIFKNKIGVTRAPVFTSRSKVLSPQDLICEVGIRQKLMMLSLSHLHVNHFIQALPHI